MAKYIVFAGIVQEIGKTFERCEGYLESLIDQGFLDGPVESETVHGFIKNDEIDWFLGVNFPGDNKLKKVLEGMALPPVYDIARVKIINGKNIKDVAKKFSKRYGLKYKIYTD